MYLSPERANKQWLLKDENPSPWQVTNLEGTTPLHEALRNGHEEVLLYLLELDPGMASSVNVAGENLLYLAAESHCEKVMEKIVNWGLSYSLSHCCHQFSSSSYFRFMYLHIFYG